jgi:hypothetical protein
MLLLGETGGGVPVQVNGQALHDRYAEMVRRVEPLGDFAEANPGCVGGLNADHIVTTTGSVSLCVRVKS